MIISYQVQLLYTFGQAKRNPHGIYYTDQRQLLIKLAINAGHGINLLIFQHNIIKSNEIQNYLDNETNIQCYPVDTVYLY